MGRPIRLRLLRALWSIVLCAALPAGSSAHPTTQIIDASGDGAGSALDLPYGIDVDASGNVYVTGRTSDTVFRIAPDGSVSEIYGASTGPGTLLDAPHGIAVSASGDVHVVGEGSDTVVKIAPGGGAPALLIDGSGDGAGQALGRPWRLALGPQGDVYVAGYDTDNAFQVTPTGTITQIIDATGDGLGHALNIPRDVAVGPAGDVWVTGSNDVFRIAPGGTITHILDSTGDGQGNSLYGAQCLTVDPASGDLYVCGITSDNVFRVTSAGVVTEILDASGDGFGNPLDYPNSVAVGPNGHVYVAGLGSDNVFEITPAGVVTEIIDATGDGLGHAMDGPREVVVGADGVVYVAAGYSDNAFAIEPAPPHGVPPPLPLAIAATPLATGAAYRRGVDVGPDGTVAAIHVPAPPDTWTCTPGTLYSPPFPGTATSLGGAFHEYNVALAIADDGTPVGYVGTFGSGTCFGPSGAFVFGPGGGLLAGGFTGGYSIAANDMNASGRLVGIAVIGGVLGGATWANAGAFARALPAPAGAGTPFPNAINDAGLIVSGGPRAGVWENDAGDWVWTYLGELPGGSSSAAYDLNADGVIVGESHDGTRDRAVLWRPSAGGWDVEVLPVPYAGGECEAAHGISDSGFVVGVCTPAGGNPTGVAWRLDGSTVTFAGSLVPLDGDFESDAQAVNDAGLATGSSSGGGVEHPVAWQIVQAPGSVPMLGPTWPLVAGLAAAGLARLRRRPDAPGRG